jgi:hypothetical protein
VKKFLPYIAVGVAVYMLRNRIAGLPGVSRLPAL